MCGRYVVCRIVASDVTTPPMNSLGDVRCGTLDSNELTEVNCHELRALGYYGGDGGHGCGAWVDGQLAAACWCVSGHRCKNHCLWPLHNNEAKRVQVTTSKSYRSRGIAATLIRYSADEMRKRGIERSYAKNWHSNNASLAAFHEDRLMLRPWYRFTRLAGPRLAVCF
jgi:GNAT superfamily N-acetyltransferase